MKDLICFFKVGNLELVRRFYEDILHLKLYKDQTDCLIYETEDSHKLGFCMHFPVEIHCESMITFVYDTKDEVDEMYHMMKEHLLTPFHHGTHERFNIYHFFVNDFNGLKVEFQVFL